MAHSAVFTTVQHDFRVKAQDNKKKQYNRFVVLAVLCRLVMGVCVVAAVARLETYQCGYDAEAAG